MFVTQLKEQSKNKRVLWILDAIEHLPTTDMWGMPYSEYETLLRLTKEEGEREYSLALDIVTSVVTSSNSIESLVRDTGDYEPILDRKCDGVLAEESADAYIRCTKLYGINKKPHLCG